MFVKILLAAWSGASLLWWMISWWLVNDAAGPPRAFTPAKERKSLTIFKPLSRLDGRGLAIEARGLESFVAQLDGNSELLLGVHEIDWPEVSPFVERMQATYPGARVIVVRRSGPDTLANPKIAWQKFLMLHASGELWLWSDADIVAPPDFLAQARAEFEICGAETLTFPYAIRTLPHPPAILDALFVNAEFYPGALLLRKLGPVDFGLGAALLFACDTFLRKVDWESLGSALADDFMLGQMMKPVRLGSITLETVADVTDWRVAFGHYYRWKKTIFWCDPLGFAGLVLVMPLLGWAGFVAWHPAHFWAWAGLIGTMQMDVFFAALLFRRIRCAISLSSVVAMEVWSISRILFWIVCLLPGRVTWREKCWKGFRQPA